ncbi:MAG TPA: SDR family oxidoreductase [Clostridia bacterium]|nr:SDR family oxidoreductase [Clostridia bacterium]
MESKVVVISGTSKGIGKGVAEHFIGKGYIVHGCSRGEGTINHVNYLHKKVDISIENDVREWIREIKKSSGRIDILLCNAGYAPANYLVNMTSGKVMNDVLTMNVNGTLFLCREVSKIMMRQRSGRIITVSSMAQGLHLEGTAAYASSKAAIVEMTKILAKEMSQFNITCNVIAPSMYMTDGVSVLGEQVIQRALASLTLKRQLKIEELTNVIDFYCAEESGCITGQVIYMGLVN